MAARIGTAGTLLSCVLVAYGFARFRFPGRNLLFLLLLSTIFLPAAVTLIPTYTIFARLGWINTWLPLLVPAFFANAYDVFLLRQYFLTIPRDLDEAAHIDGAGPMRTLISVVLGTAAALATLVQKQGATEGRCSALFPPAGERWRVRTQPGEGPRRQRRACP